MARDLFKPTYSYGGIGTPDLSSAAKLISAPGEVFRGWQAEANKAAAIAEDQRRWEIQNARQQAEFDQKQAAKQQEDLLGAKLAEALGKRTRTRTISTPDTITNLDVIKGTEEANKRIAERNKDILGGRQAYADITNARMNEILDSKKSRYAQSAEALDRNISSLENRIEQDVAQGQVLGIPSDVSMLTKQLEALKNARSNIGLRDSDYIQAHEQAIRDVPGADAFTKQLMTESTVPKPEVVKGSTRTVTEKLSKKEWKDMALSNIMSDPNITGRTKIAAINSIDKQADSIFGKNKELSFDQALRLQQFNEERSNKLANMQSYRDLYPNMPKSITTPEMAKQWVTSKEKQSEKAVKNAGKVTYNNKNREAFIASLDVPLQSRSIGRNDSTLLGNFLDDKEIKMFMEKQKVNSKQLTDMIKNKLKTNDDLEDVLEDIGTTWLGQSKDF